MEQGYNLASRTDAILTRIDEIQEEIEKGLSARDRRLKLSEPLYQRLQKTAGDLLDAMYLAAGQPPTYQEDYQPEF